MIRKSSTLPDHFRRMGSAYLVLVISMIPAVVVYFRVKHNVAARDQTRFEQVVQTTEETMVQRMENYVSALRGVRGLFEAGGNVDPHEWQEYVHSIDIKYNYRGMMDLGVARRVRAPEKESHVAAMRNVWPEYALKPPGDRDEYFPIIYLATPSNRTNRVPGWDAFSEPSRRTAIERSFLEDDPIATGKITLYSSDGANQEPGFILYVPIHRPGARPGTVEERKDTTVGVVFASFLARELGDGLFGKPSNPAIDYEVYDGKTPAHDSLLYDSDGVRVADDRKAAPRFSRTLNIEGLGRTWTVHISTLPAFEIDSRQNLPDMALFGGLTISFLLFAIAFTQARARSEAERLSVSLRQSEESLKRANEALTGKIAERQQAEKELAAEKEQLFVTLGSLAEGVITTDAAGKVLLLNKAAEMMTGWDRREAVSQPLAGVFQLLDERTRAACENPVDRVLNTDAIFDNGTPAVLRSNRGGEKVVVTSGAPMHDHGGSIIGVVLVFRDVTENRKLEAELNKASKLESLGLLAGGIAHDFNNILTSILGNISLGRMQLPENDPSQERLARAEQSCQRAKELTNQLLTFARGGAPVKKTKAIAQLLKEACDLAVLGSPVRCEFSFPDDLWAVDVDPAQISQVLNNILINAVQAMPEGGIIRVSAEKVPARTRRGLPSESASYVKISIHDSGPGIPPEHLHRIFDPFFTTKHKGRGLGLATAYSIIRKHEGLIEVESKVQNGAMFNIYLPASARPAAPATEQQDKPVTGRGRVLVMDDETDILNFSQVALKRLGYDVDVARDGAEALNRYREASESGRPFSAVIMDLTIPGGVGGKEAIKRFLEFDPRVAAIVSSGYSNDPVMSDFEQHGFRGVVAKPYEIRELARTLKEVIETQGRQD